MRFIPLENCGKLKVESPLKDKEKKAFSNAKRSINVG